MGRMFDVCTNYIVLRACVFNPIRHELDTSLFPVAHYLSPTYLPSSSAVLETRNHGFCMCSCVGRYQSLEASNHGEDS